MSPNTRRATKSSIIPNTPIPGPFWSVFLRFGIEPIGLQDDFFEAGGHSLLATQVMSRLHQRLGVDVPLRTLFEARTIAVFAERVAELSHGAREDREEIEL